MNISRQVQGKLYRQVRSQLRTILSAIWLVFTMSLVSWWFVLNLRGTVPTEDVPGKDLAQHNRMVFWEGSTLLVTVLFGGAVLIFLSRKDDQRNERLKFFFSNFTHDIRTSISRLRLQAEILAEEVSESRSSAENRVLKSLLADISRLDLQLENSLLLSNETEFDLLIQQIEIRALVQSLKIEFEDLQFDLEGNAQVQADSRALRSIFRNLFENSRRHGLASKIKIKVEQNRADQVKITVVDNGSGSQTSVASLGRQIVQQSSGGGTGIGLYLCRQLVTKMRGAVEFSSKSGEGFETIFFLRGKIL